LSTDATTSLESVDYWLDFDKDDGLTSIPESYEAVGGQTMVDAKGKAPMTGQWVEPRKSRRGRRWYCPRWASRPASQLTTCICRPANPNPQAQQSTVKDEYIDDSALDNALSDEDAFSINVADQLSKIDTAPPQEVPPRETLYSTPLSWERPQPGIRMDSLIGLHSPSLNEEEQRRLIAIAMNPGPSMGGLGSNINFNFTGMNTSEMPTMTFGAGLGGAAATTTTTAATTATTTPQGPKPVSPPQPPAAQPKPPPPSQPKKQGSVSGEKGKEKPKSGDRTAHNDIERKYRTNLKDKISELRNAVPSLRTISENGGEDDGTQRPAKVSKVSGAGSWLDLIRKGKADTHTRELCSQRQPSISTISSAGTSKSCRSIASSQGDYKHSSSFSMRRLGKHTPCRRTAGRCSIQEGSASLQYRYTYYPFDSTHFYNHQTDYHQLLFSLRPSIPLYILLWFRLFPSVSL
jgi:hypothetical protein